MSISFIRVDDRMIHGQTLTRWALEKPCDGLIAVNDNAAKNPTLKAAYKAASPKKTFVWTIEEFEQKKQKVLDSSSEYFLITKNPLDMKRLLIDNKLPTGDLKTVIIGPCNKREGSTTLGDGQSITQEEARAFEEIMQGGFTVEFALLKEKSIGTWSKFRGQFGFG